MNAVAATPVPADTRFGKLPNGTVHDIKQNLIWSPTLSKKCVTHAEAEKLCAEYSPDGEQWRMPTVEELFLLADRTRTDPAIDVKAFPDTQSDWYWSSTILASSSSSAWIVNFLNGYAGLGNRDDGNALARAVRSVAPGQ